jgi:hypothetical protein
MSMSRLLAIKDPARRATAAANQMRRKQDEVDALRAVRDKAALEMIGSGVPVADVARATGTSRAAAHKRYTHK